MKKLLIIFSLLTLSPAFLVSCKNPETSKQINNATTINSTSSSQSNNAHANSLFNPDAANSPTDSSSIQPAVVETGIYQDKEGLYHIRYILETGKTYNFNSKIVSTQTLTAREKSQSITEESYDPVSFTVQNFKDGKYTLQVKIGGKKVITKADGQQAVFDTNGKKPDNPDQAKMWKLYRAISQVPFTLEMDIYGNVLRITGMDALYSKAKSSVSGDLQGKQLDDFMTSFKQGVNPETFKAQFEGAVVKFPPKGLKVGEKWNTDPSAKNKGYNQLVKVDDNTTEIKVSGTIPSHSETKNAENGITLKLSVKGNQSGKIVIDNRSGWVSKANYSVTITETQTATRGEESEQIIQKIVNNVYIN